jgi:hypothetical protein
MKRMHKWAAAAALLGAGQTWALDIQNVTPKGRWQRFANWWCGWMPMPWHWARPRAGTGGLQLQQAARRQRSLEQRP